NGRSELMGRLFSHPHPEAALLAAPHVGESEIPHQDEQRNEQKLDVREGGEFAHEPGVVVENELLQLVLARAELNADRLVILCHSAGTLENAIEHALRLL